MLCTNILMLLLGDGGMVAEFDRSVFHGYLLKGDVTDAIEYLAQYPQEKELYRKYKAVFEKEEYVVFEVDDVLNEILIIYQKYYRDVFYLHIDAEKAATVMKNRFTDFFCIKNPNSQLSQIEEQEIAEAFQKRLLHFLGGKTSGYWGPYIWKTTESTTYDVELPDGRQPYLIRFLDGFITKGWYDYVSFGEISTGGWTDGDGIIHCVKSSYDLEDESFSVSLLKHEAQHAMDLTKYRNISSEELEYRAKLVELIYSCRRNLLQQFIHEADASKAGNGHSLAANRIVEEFAERVRKSHKELYMLPIAEIQAVSRELLARSNEEMKNKYGGF